MSNIQEGPLAHEVVDANKRRLISESYKMRYPSPVETPLTHPWKFDPLIPPTGWAYDPYYEVWIKTDRG